VGSMDLVHLSGGLLVNNNRGVVNSNTPRFFG
jgi:hypothetical protein